MKQRPILSEEDIDFITYVLDDHYDLLEEHIGCPWENDLRKERRRMYSSMASLGYMAKYAEATIDEETFQFLEFVMKERTDFTCAGMSKSVLETPEADSTRATKLIEKIRRHCHFPSVRKGEIYTLVK